MLAVLRFLGQGLEASQEILEGHQEHFQVSRAMCLEVFLEGWETILEVFLEEWETILEVCLEVCLEVWEGILEMREYQACLLEV